MGGRRGGGTLANRNRMRDFLDRPQAILLPHGHGRHRGQRGLLLKGVVVSLLVALALGIGSYAGSVDLRSSGVRPAAIVLGVGSLLLCVIRPGWGWTLALLAAACVPVMHRVGPLLGLADMQPPRPMVETILFSLGPALIGALAGSILNRIVIALGGGAAL